MASKQAEENFGEFLDNVAVHAGIAKGIGIGSQLKIFDVMVTLGPKPYTEIANAGNWKPRFVMTDYLFLYCSVCSFQNRIIS